MASTSAVHESHLPRVLEEIEELFSWNPPRLVRGSKKQSTSFCLPAYYDKHFSAKFVLKRVEQLPSLVQILKDNVDRALDAAKPTLPPLSSGFVTAERRQEEEILYYDLEAKNEQTVANFYDKYTSHYCLSLASMLALHPAAPEWANLLLWTQSVSSSGYAIMDGELRFMTDPGVKEVTKLHRENVLGTMKANDRHLFELMRASGMSLATWEIKSLGADTSEVLSAVRILGTFSWTLCSFDRNESANIKRHKTELEKVDRIVVGHDAKCFSWLSSHADSEAGPSTFPPPPPLAEAGPPTVPPPSPSRSLFSLSSLTSLTTTEDGEPSPTTNAGKKRKRGGGSPSQDNSKKLKRNDANDTDADDDDNTTEEEEEQQQKAFQDRHDVTAQNLVQQVTRHTTSESVKFIMLTCRLSVGMGASHTS
jgi:hypothetical protein